jgi:riboflavin biosynthesis pyrimidine reductase
MSVIATLVVGSNGATTCDGKSSALSTAADRDRFIALHRRAGAYIVGRNSAARESYAHSPAPLLILTRSPQQDVENEWDVSQGFSDAMAHIRNRYPSPIVVESGPTLLLSLVQAGEIDALELSISPVKGDGHFVDVESLLSYFEITSDTEVDGTRLLECRYKSNT